jgi:hypothetical protein
MLNRLRVFAHRKSLTVNKHKSEVMCFNSRSDNRLSLLYSDGKKQLSYTDTFIYLGMVCDKNINLATAAAALRPITVGTFRVKKCTRECPYKQAACTYLTPQNLCNSC